MGNEFTTEQIKRWESLGIDNAFIFYRVMRDKPERCCRLLQLILPELDIRRISFVNAEKTIDEGFDIKGVRLDAFCGDDEGRRYDIEMQVRNEDDLARRSRYNQSMIDSELLDKGSFYSELPDTYIVFICKFDMFGAGYYRYTFKNICEEDNTILLQDGATKIYINPNGNKGQISKELKAFLDFVNGIKSEDVFVKELEAAISKVKRNAADRRFYMTWEMELLAERKISEERGRREGKAEGGLQLAGIITRKLTKGKSYEMILDELDETDENLRPVYDAVIRCAPNYKDEDIYRELLKNNMM